MFIYSGVRGKHFPLPLPPPPPIYPSHLPSPIYISEYQYIITHV